MVQGVNNFPAPMCGGPVVPHCHCNDNDYIKKWFLFFETEASFKAHLEKNFINPDSVSFIDQTGQIYAQGKFFGICKEDFNQLKSVVYNHTKMIQNILGLEGPSVGDGLINTLKDIQDFLNGFTTEDNLNDYINKIKFALQGSIEDVQLQLNTKATELTKKVDDALLELNRVEIALKARCDLHDSEISLLKQRLVSAENDLTRITGEWNEFSTSYINWQKYVEGRLDTLNESFLALQASDNKLHNEIEELNAKVNRYDARIENCVSMVQNCYTAITEAEQKFNDLRTEVSDFYNTKGHANGLCPLNEDGQVDSQFLPSYVDDVLEFVSLEQFPVEGEFSKIYVALDTNLTYRWTGTQYIEISKSLGLGELPTTAFPGDRGKTVEEALDRHKADDNNPHKVTKAQLGLGLVDNTPDQYKPVSVPQASAMTELHQTITGETNTAIEAAKDELKKGFASEVEPVNQTLTQHIADKGNPHNVTKSQVGLSKVDNTADNDKPVSVPQKIAIDAAKKAGTDAQSDIDAHKANKQNPHEVTKEQVGLGNVDNTSDAQKPVSILQQIAIDNVQTNLNLHKNDKSNPHEVTKSQIGLDRVDNTSDAEKPISTPQLQALKEQRDEIMGRIDEIAGEYSKIPGLEQKVNSMSDELANKTAEIDSKIATAKSEVKSEVKAEIIGGASTDYDTLKEIETWIGNHQDVYQALVSTVGEKAALSYVNEQLGLKADADKVYTKEEADGKFLTDHQSLTEYAKKTEVTAEIAEAVSPLATKQEVTTGLAGKADKSDTYTKNEVDTELGKKANSADVFNKSEVEGQLATKANAADVYKKTETYTKEEVDAAIKVTDDKLSSYYQKTETYTKAEVDQAIKTAVEAALQQVATMVTWKQA